MTMSVQTRISLRRSTVVLSRDIWIIQSINARRARSSVINTEYIAYAEKHEKSELVMMRNDIVN
jgi:hypothetical protein